MHMMSRKSASTKTHAEGKRHLQTAACIALLQISDVPSVRIQSSHEAIIMPH